MLSLSKDEVAEKLASLNIFYGDIVLVHSQILAENLDISQRRAFLSLLKDYLGSEGSIIMDLSGSNFDIKESSEIQDLEDYSKLRALMPGFNKASAHLYANDLLAVTLANEKDSLMSKSFSYPYIGVGKYAKLILMGQSENFPNGNLSPLDKLYQLRAKILLVNSHLNDLCLNNYLFETSQASVITVNGGMVVKEGRSIWKKFLEKSVDKDVVDKTIKSSEIKKLFYYSDLKGLNLLSSEVRAYVDYGRNFLKEKD